MRYVQLGITLITLTFLITLAVNSAGAETMSGKSLNLEIEQVTPTPTPTPLPKELQPVANVFNGLNYTVDETDSTPISITSFSDFIDYGHISVTNPILRRSQLSIDSMSKNGLSVIGFEDHALTSSSSAVVPDTTCDSGTCNEKIASLWTNTLTFGFGYHTDSLEKDFFRQFANQSQNKSPQPLLNAASDKTLVSIIYKMNISTSTDVNLPYQNTVTFVAVPNL